MALIVAIAAQQCLIIELKHLSFTFLPLALLHGVVIGRYPALTDRAVVTCL